MKHQCKFCGKICRLQYCSKKCWYQRNGNRKNIICKNCAKCISVSPCGYSDKFCSFKCYLKYRKNSQVLIQTKCKQCKKILICVKNSRSKIFCNHQCANTFTMQHCNKINIKKHAYNMGKKYGRRNALKSQKTMKKSKIGWYNSDVQKINSMRAQKVLYKKYKWLWNNTKFITRDEMLCAKKILIRPKINYNCQYVINGKRIDFYPQKEDKMFQGCFVEFHPQNKFLRPNETSKSYYVSRRKLLNNNGYKDKKLIVIQNLKELENYK